MAKRASAWFGLLFFISHPAAAGQQPAAEPVAYDFTEPHMGTKVRVVLYAADKPAAVAAVRAAFKRFRDLEDVMSDYKKSSEVMKLCAANDAAPGKIFSVGEDLAAVLGHALNASKASGGAFDATVGPLSQLWRETRKTKTLPPAEILAAARAKVGFEKVTLDRKARTVTFAIPGVRLDFGGIGKGFAADEALKVLKANGVTRAMVAASGDVVVGDPPPGRDAWAVEIAPIGTGKPGRVVNLANAAVSTSGDLFQVVEIAGVRYSHVLDPKTGLGLTGRRSVTVIAPRGVTADSYSKAASILPAADAAKLIDAIDGAATYIVVKESDAADEVVTASKRFAGFLRK